MCSRAACTNMCYTCCLVCMRCLLLGHQEPRLIACLARCPSCCVLPPCLQAHQKEEAKTVAPVADKTASKRLAQQLAAELAAELAEKQAPEAPAPAKKAAGKSGELSRSQAGAGATLAAAGAVLTALLVPSAREAIFSRCVPMVDGCVLLLLQLCLWDPRALGLCWCCPCWRRIVALAAHSATASALLIFCFVRCLPWLPQPTHPPPSLACLPSQVCGRGCGAQVCGGAVRQPAEAGGGAAGGPAPAAGKRLRRAPATPRRS